MEKHEQTQDDLSEKLETSRNLNDRLTELLGEELSRREQRYRESEGIADPIAGTQSNMDIVTDLGAAFDQDHDHRQEVETRLDEAERKSQLGAVDLANVSDAITARVDSLQDEMAKEDVDRLLEKLADDFDLGFLR